MLIASGCSQHVKYKKKVYVAVSDSSCLPDSNYEGNFHQWKKVYEECLKYQLFPNAFYMGLQARLYVGSIINISGQNVSEKISVLDTTHMERMLTLFSPGTSSNCY